MYADFSVLKIHLSEEEYNLLDRAREIFHKMTDFVDDGDRIQIIIDKEDDDQYECEIFNVDVLTDTIDGLEKML